MSRFLPHPPYAEDQPGARAILTSHVWARGWITGAIIGAGITTARQLVPRTRTPDFGSRLVLSAARGGIWTTPLIMAALYGRMRGREMIEWQDRSWRLLENRGQVETDSWTLAGTALGPVVWTAMGAGKGLTGRRFVMGIVGAGSLGGIGGTVGYLVWRYGIGGGKFPEGQAI